MAPKYAAISFCLNWWALGCLDSSEPTAMQLSSSNQESTVPCNEYAPVSAQDWPENVIAESADSVFSPGYPTRVRRAVAASNALIWNHDGELDSQQVRYALKQMYCNYRGFPNLQPLYDESEKYPFDVIGGHYTQNYSILKSIVRDLVDIHPDELVSSAPPISEELAETNFLLKGTRAVYKELGLSIENPERPFGVFRKKYPVLSWWVYKGIYFLHPSAHESAYQRIAEIFNQLRNAQSIPCKNLAHPNNKLDLITELTFLFAHLRPNSSSGNWGLLYILVRQAYAQVTGVSLNRASQGLDWYMLLLAYNPEDAKKLFQVWHKGLLDARYNDTKAAPLQRYRFIPNESMSSLLQSNGGPWRWPNRKAGFVTRPDPEIVQEQRRLSSLIDAAQPITQDLGLQALCVRVCSKNPQAPLLTEQELQTYEVAEEQTLYFGFGNTETSACDAAEAEMWHHHQLRTISACTLQTLFLQHPPSH